MNFNLLYDQSKCLLENYKDYKSNKKFKNYDENKFESEMANTYSYLYTNAKSIFKLCLSGKLDLQVLYFMINQAKNLKNNTISPEEASKKVSEKLIEKIVKPQT